jgi:hypothetical protein
MLNLQLKHYGDNTPDGEYFAVLISLDEERFPLGKRMVFKFAIINQDTFEPQLDKYDNPMFAVAVCNYSQMKSSKSKIVKVTRALISEDKYDPIKSLSEIPRPEDLYKTKTHIRVKQKTSDKGKTVSNITHIKRPRDGIWESILSSFDKQKKKNTNDIDWKDDSELTTEQLVDFFSS